MGEIMKLCKSYRSTCEITEFAQQIRTNTELEPVARHGKKPQVLQFDNEKEELSAIKKFNSYSSGIRLQITWNCLQNRNASL